MNTNESTLVLVVDDNETSRYNKTRLLRRGGFEVLEAASGSEALDVVVAKQPRAVVLDINLPDIDGWEVCRRIKADEATAGVVVLQVSATHVTESDTVRALEGGADGSLTEPIQPPVLIATLRALLRARAAEDALRAALGREQEARGIAEAASRTKDEFLATLSHELRSPLGTILTWVTLLRGGAIDAVQASRGLESIERNTRLQMKLVDDLLDVSRITSGKMLLDARLVDLKSVVDAAVESMHLAAEGKKIRIAALVDPTIGPIFGDPARLQQVLWNLLSNAVRFTGDGGSVEVRVESVASQAHITVKDTGIGIDPAFLPHIFERFRQADASTTRREGGLGLGLAIVRHLVELHGGSVYAESEGQGTGAKFTIVLPMAAVRKSVKTQSPACSESPTAPDRLSGIRILVVDDEDDARDAIALILEQCGAEVVRASSVRAAMAALSGFVPDVVVSDIAMPKEDGFDLIRQVRALRMPWAETVPAVALTSYARDEERNAIIAAGYQSTLTKPIDAGELAMGIAALVAKTASG